MVGNRSFKKILKALFEKQHYVAFINMFINYTNPAENLWRYLTARGDYPYKIKVKTPTGTVSPTLYGHHDLLTVNEIFCRLDYYAHKDVETVVDIGSNIGISAIYFLTRNNNSKCHLFEPDKRNISKLHRNLIDFANRYQLKEKAVSNTTGVVNFGIEETGRYGGVGVKTENEIEVDCININSLLKNILDEEDKIDILKMDIEGLEVKTLKAIKVRFLKRIKRIYLEANPQQEVFPEVFIQKQYGTVCQLINKKTSQ